MQRLANGWRGKLAGEKAMAAWAGMAAGGEDGEPRRTWRPA